jgi:pyridoxamine 5'-phosphate oxidase
MDPLKKFAQWMEEARKTDLPEPTAFTLATVGADGRPGARVLLLKGLDERGFVFYTNFESRKGREILARPYAALCFYWPPLARQVRVEGTLTQVSDQEADAYFATRARGSQIGAWASPQSRELGSYAELVKSVARVVARFGFGAVPRPPYWSGFRLAPESIEFWTAKENRLHVRELFVRQGDGWEEKILAP